MSAAAGRWLGMIAAGLALVLTQGAANAQSAADYPARLIRVVTGSAAGGGADIAARQLVPRLSDALKTQIIIDNRPGVAGMIANEFVSRAAPDGYTLLLQPGSFMIVSSILNSKGAWDPNRNLAPVIQIGAYGFVFVVHPSVPARSVKEFIAVAQARPGAITFVSTGVGSNFHLAAELFGIRARVALWHVPYKGSPAAILDLVAGRADATFMQAQSLLPHIRAGKLRVLGVTGPRRNPLLPEAPTIAEAGVRGYEITGTEWLMAPAGTPHSILARLNATVTQLLDTPELKEAWANKGNEFAPGSPEQFADRLQQEYDRIAAVIREAGVKPEF